MIERRLAAALLVAVVLFRSGVFVIWPQAHFDSDSAITGLMATHLSQGRAFPVFWYGQSYMLAVEAYLAAPLFVMAGPSVTALKLPLLAINIAVVLLLLRVLEREGGLRPALAAVPILFFALPAPGTAARLLEPNGGNLEPFLYAVLIWLLRNRPVLLGVVLGIGFLQREFTIYALFALLTIEAASRVLFTREQLLQRMVMLVSAAAVWLIVQALKHISSAAGPGTTFADVSTPSNNIVELANRLCFEPGTIGIGLAKMATEHWPALFGTWRLALLEFGIDSRLSQGGSWSWLLVVGIFLIPLATIGFRLMTGHKWQAPWTSSVYFLLVALFSLAGYVVGRCGEVSFHLMRYDLLALLGGVGLGAWFLQVTRTPAVRGIWIALFCAWVGLAGITHARLWAEYLRDPPVGGKQLMIQHLDAQGTRYVLTDYWIAYVIAFITNERIVAAPTDLVRIPEYNRLVEQHRGEAVRISRRPCTGGREIMRGVYFCQP
jgi:hypothetical protein